MSWIEAVAYCNALNAQQMKLGTVPPGYVYRLPTEAEWEYACRAGTTTEFTSGPELHCSQARFSFSAHTGASCLGFGPLPVGSCAPNAWGLYDMHGNVAEWCLDSHAPLSPSPAVDPYVGGFPDRVVRGGAWAFDSSICRSAARDFGFPEFASSGLGFRVVLAPVLLEFVE